MALSTQALATKYGHNRNTLLPRHPEPIVRAQEPFSRDGGNSSGVNKTINTRTIISTSLKSKNPWCFSHNRTAVATAPLSFPDSAEAAMNSGCCFTSKSLTTSTGSWVINKNKRLTSSVLNPVVGRSCIKHSFNNTSVTWTRGVCAWPVCL